MLKTRIVLTVDRAGLQGGVHLGESYGRRIDADGFPEELPELAGRHAQLDTGEICRRADQSVGLQIDVARSEIDGRDDLDTELIAGHLDELPADIALERLLHVIRVAEQVSRGHQRPCGDLLRNILGRQVGHLEVPALLRDELGALLK